MPPRRKSGESGERASKIVEEKAAEGRAAAAGGNAGIEKARNGPGCWRFRLFAVAPSRSCPAREMRIFGIPAAGVFSRESRGKANADNRADFPGRARDESGRAPAFAGGAPYRRPARAEKFPESLDGDIMLECLPPRAPELDPAEIQ